MGINPLFVFKGGREKGYLLLKSTLEFTMQTFTRATVENKPSANQTHQQAHSYTETLKHSLLMGLLSCSLSKQGVDIAVEISTQG